MEIAYLLLCHQVSGIITPDSNRHKFEKALRVEQSRHAIVALVVQGQKTMNIATCISQSKSTVKSPISRISKKLIVKNRTQLATLSSDAIVVKEDAPLSVSSALTISPYPAQL